MNPNFDRDRVNFNTQRGNLVGAGIGMQAGQTDAACQQAQGSSRPPAYVSVTVDCRATNSFSEALYALKNSQRIARAGWNGSGMWAAMQKPDNHSKMTRAYLYIKTADIDNVPSDLVPWVPSVSDILADDWAIFPG